MERSLTSVQEALQYLFSRTTGGVRLGLERTRALLAQLGDPHLAYPCFHVAGTNGKGSTIATAAALLRSRGLRVGVYTSPHLVEFRERIVVNDTPIGEQEIVDFVREWTPEIERLEATFFEGTTAMAFAHFARVGVDVALIETGLGGRLDSSNVVDPVAAAVTSIGYDHMEYLGHTLEEIAAEKAGIFKPGRPAVIGEWDPQLRALLAEHARAAGASDVRIVADRVTIDDVVVDGAGTSFLLGTDEGTARVRTPLAGIHQSRNVALAIEMLAAAGEPWRMTLGEAVKAIPETFIPGRFHRHGKWIFDVAHNADGSRVLAGTIRSVAPPRPIWAVLCVLGDKDWRAMASQVSTVVDRIILTNAPTAPESRAWDLDEVERVLSGEEMVVEVISHFETALRRAEGAAATVLVTGSFHTVGDAMARLQLSPFSR